MSIIEAVIFASIGVLGGIAVFLCLWCKYNDGIIGKMALGAVAMGASMLIVESAVDAHRVLVNPEFALLLGGLSVFWLRHVARRVHRRWRKAHPMRRSEDNS